MTFINRCVRGGRSLCCSEFLIRGAALFLGSFLLIGWLLYLTGPGRYDATVWWVDLRVLPAALSVGLSVLFACALIHRAVLPSPGDRALRARAAVLLVMLGVLIVNTGAALWLHVIESASVGVAYD